MSLYVVSLRCPFIRIKGCGSKQKTLFAQVGVEKNLSGLHRALSVWLNGQIPSATLQNLLESPPKRAEAVIAEKGDQL